jgi:hypothetical protein
LGDRRRVGGVANGLRQVHSVSPCRR